MKQYEAVAEAMRQLGGYATFGQLYKTVLKVPNCTWKTKTPFASIRGIVQTHPKVFFKIKPGLWGLIDQRKAILQTLGLDGDSPTIIANEFGHSYYQGLAIEYGNLKGNFSYVTSQDRNKKYLDTTLGNVAILSEIPEFTYQHLIQRAKMIDVIWFNNRNLPIAFFEIEHSTDIYNSLLKFLEFQDFRVKFYIVADITRKAEFASKISSTAFLPIRNNVTFLDYESLSKLHSAATEVSLAEQRFGL